MANDKEAQRGEERAAEPAAKRVKGPDPHRPQDWHPLDAAAARAITAETNTPGIVFGLHPSSVPEAVRLRMSDVSSYYVSNYGNPVPLTRVGVTAGQEALVVRNDAGTTKNYNYLIATSSNGAVQFCGPFKGEFHHVTEGQRVEVNSLFIGASSLTTRK